MNETDQACIMCLQHSSLEIQYDLSMKLCVVDISYCDDNVNIVIHKIDVELIF